jgi:S1-C subfamily serine protease
MNLSLPSAIRSAAKLAATIAILGLPEIGFGQVANPKQAPGVADLVAQIAPSVVSITTTLKPERTGSDALGERTEDNEPNTIRWGQGSGVIISPDGYILTNNHVVARGSGIIVTREDVQKDYTATVVGTDPETDLAVIKIQEKNLPTLHFADPGSYRVGDAVLAIGNALGRGQSVSMGIISAIDRALGPGDFEDYIQTDAAINHGNSGGALVNLNGELVGINSMFLPGGQDNQGKSEGTPSGVNFAIAAPLAKAVMQELMQEGKVRRAYLGAELETLTAGLAANFGIPENLKGVVVEFIMNNSPADQAGLRPKDVITALNGKSVRSRLELERTIIFSPPGSTEEITFYRDNNKMTTKVVLQERPPQKQTDESASQ